MPDADRGRWRLQDLRLSRHPRIVDLSVAGGLPLPYGYGPFGPVYGNYDLEKLHINKDGPFEVILSNQRPSGYKGARLRRCW